MEYNESAKILMRHIRSWGLSHQELKMLTDPIIGIIHNWIIFPDFFEEDHLNDDDGGYEDNEDYQERAEVSEKEIRERGKLISKKLLKIAKRWNYLRVELEITQRKMLELLPEEGWKYAYSKPYATTDELLIMIKMLIMNWIIDRGTPNYLKLIQKIRKIFLNSEHSKAIEEFFGEYIKKGVRLSDCLTPPDDD